MLAPELTQTMAGQFGFADNCERNSAMSQLIPAISSSAEVTRWLYATCFGSEACILSKEFDGLCTLLLFDAISEMWPS
jgi:hypothetical protein